jgi:hypothetical protein
MFDEVAKVALSNAKVIPALPSQISKPNSLHKLVSIVKIFKLQRRSHFVRRNHLIITQNEFSSSTTARSGYI